jgi:DNA-binding FadR family transcriptional regulator
LELARNAIGTYVSFLDLSIDAVIDTRLALERLAIRYAIERLDGPCRAALAGLVLRAEEGGGVRVAAMGKARNLAREGIGEQLLSLFLGSLSDLVMHSAWTSALDDTTFVSIVDRLAEANRKQVLAILADDYVRAMEFERHSLDLVRELHEASSVLGRYRSAPNATERSYAVYPAARPAKKAERVAWKIRRLIADEQLVPGTNLGSEGTLMAQYGVGRPVLREAIRTLERLGICAMQRGGASGLTVTTPDPNRVIALARSYLERCPDKLGDALAIRGVLADVAPNPAVDLLLSIMASG